MNDFFVESIKNQISICADCFNILPPLANRLDLNLGLIYSRQIC
jgi:hypothetical protein